MNLRLKQTVMLNFVQSIRFRVSSLKLFRFSYTDDQKYCATNNTIDPMAWPCRRAINYRYGHSNFSRATNHRSAR